MRKKRLECTSLQAAYLKQNSIAVTHPLVRGGFFCALVSDGVRGDGYSPAGDARTGVEKSVLPAPF